jgi:TonB family protein
MFDFAISQQQRHTPSRRKVVSWVASCLVHVLAIEVLIAYPSLLGPGIAHWFRASRIGRESKEEQIIWRTVAVLRNPTAMQGPSTSTLRANTYDWARAAREAMKSPPIRISWKNEPTPRPKAEPQPPSPSLGIRESSEAARVASEAAAAAAAAAGSGAVQQEPPAGSGRVVYLPAPAPVAEPRQIPRQAPTSAGTTPGALPPPVPKPDSNREPPAPTPASQQASAATQVFENKQQALQSEGSGFFDTKGFPLGQYASAVIERVKGNWSIPSNLRNSRGRTTVVFFIGKDGRYTGAQIVKSSGITSLDLAALNAVLISNPFPPLPPGFPGSQIGAKFVFAYNEQQ